MTEKRIQINKSCLVGFHSPDFGYFFISFSSVLNLHNGSFALCEGMKAISNEERRFWLYARLWISTVFRVFFCCCYCCIRWSVTCSAIIPTEQWTLNTEHWALKTEHLNNRINLQSQFLPLPLSFFSFFHSIPNFVWLFLLVLWVSHFTLCIIIIRIHRYDDVTTPVSQIEWMATGIRHIGLTQPVIYIYIIIFFQFQSDFDFFSFSFLLSFHCVALFAVLVMFVSVISNTFMFCICQKFCLDRVEWSKQLTNETNETNEHIIFMYYSH